MEQEEHIRKSQQMYAQAGGEYERVLFNAENGGFVLVHQSHNRGESYESELFVAQVLANRGRRVTLLNETGMGVGVKTPDADIDGVIGEFKLLTQNLTNVPARVQASFTRARQQGAEWVVYHLDRDESDISLVNQGLRLGFFWDRRKTVKQILVVFRDGRIKELSREEWDNGQRI